ELLRITLARPDRRNALDAELIAALTAAFSDVRDARAVVLAGEGDSFCAGADVEWMRAAAALSYEENVADSTRLRRMYEAVDRSLSEILTAGPEAARHAKRLVLDAPLDGLETAERIAERRTSDEGQEGLHAFLERRPPGWA